MANRPEFILQKKKEPKQKPTSPFRSLKKRFRYFFLFFLLYFFFSNSGAGVEKKCVNLCVTRNKRKTAVTAIFFLLLLKKTTPNKWASRLPPIIGAAHWPARVAKDPLFPSFTELFFFSTVAIISSRTQPLPSFYRVSPKMNTID